MCWMFLRFLLSWWLSVISMVGVVVSRSRILISSSVGVWLARSRASSWCVFGVVRLIWCVLVRVGGFLSGCGNRSRSF